MGRLRKKDPKLAENGAPPPRKGAKEREARRKALRAAKRLVFADMWEKANTGRPGARLFLTAGHDLGAMRIPYDAVLNITVRASDLYDDHEGLQHWVYEIAGHVMSPTGAQTKARDAEDKAIAAKAERKRLAKIEADNQREF